MATLPDSTAFGARPVPQAANSVASYSPVDSRGVGSIISGAGREMKEAANVVADTNDRQDLIVAQAAANQLEQQRLSQEFDPTCGFRNVKQGGVVGPEFVDGNTQKFTDSTTKIRDNLVNENQKKKFDRFAQVQGLQLKSSLLQHQSTQTEAFNDSTANSTVELALRTMAQRPTDEVTFQTSLTQIEGTVKATGLRKGQSEEVINSTIGKLYDAAYSTRIMSLMNGVPGAVTANPYLAEKMYQQVQDRLGPQAQITLGHQVQQAVKGVQERDVARGFIYGGKLPTDPGTLAKVVDRPLEGIVKDMESSGKRYDASGKLLTSPVGAQGEMQVMPGTSKNPGFGVTPARDDSPDELARVGRDYLGAMTARYDNPALVLAAYNAGPGQVDKWIAQYGDPRTGQISSEEWAAKIPFSETKGYVTKGLSQLGGTQLHGAPPTANELKVGLPALMEQSRSTWLNMYPGDSAGADAVASRVANYGNLVIQAQSAKQAAANDALVRGMIGSQPDGSDKPKTIDQLLLNPAAKAAWNEATPEVKDQIQRRFATASEGLTQEGANVYYSLLGKVGTDPDAFVKEDLSKYFGQMPDKLLVSLMGAQKTINSKDSAAEARGLNAKQAFSNVDDMLKPLGLGAIAKPGTGKSKTTEVFYGRLEEAMVTSHGQTGKWPNPQEVRKMAASLLTQGAESGGWWDSNKRAFEVTDQSKFYVPMPANKSSEYSKLTGDFQKVFGRAPKPDELAAFYTQYKMSGGK